MTTPALWPTCPAKAGTGLTDAQRANPPAIGSVVTYRYRDHTPKGLPRFASFLRVREVE